MSKSLLLLAFYSFTALSNFISPDLEVPGGMTIKILEHGYSPETGHIFKFEPADHPDQGSFYTNRQSLIKSIVNLDIKQIQRKPKSLVGTILKVKADVKLKTLLPPQTGGE